MEGRTPGYLRAQKRMVPIQISKRTDSKGQSGVDSPTFPGIVERSLGLQRNCCREAVSANMQRGYSAFYSWG